MSDDKKNESFDDDDEYHFLSDGEDSGSFEAQPPSSVPPSADVAPEPKKPISLMDMTKILENVKPFLDIVKNNFVIRLSLIVVVVLLFSVVIYRCSSQRLVEKESEKIAPIAVSHPKSSVPVARSDHIILKPQAQKRNLAVQEDNYHYSDTTQTALQAQVNALSTQMSSLTSNVNSVAENLRLLNNQLSQLALTVSNDAKLGSGLAEQIKQLQIKAVVARKIEIKMPRMAQYYVQAMIPGRAWLISAEGQTLTVSQGSPVADYGVVRYVDASNGQVLTSSGRTIAFSQDDS